jgi:hypothetical protein
VNRLTRCSGPARRSPCGLPLAPAAERPYRWADEMRLSLYDKNDVRVADADLDPAHPLHEGLDGSLAGHAIGRFTPGPGYSRLRPMLDAFKDAFRAGDTGRALSMSDEVDGLGFRAEDPSGRRFRVSNVQLEQGGLLFFASSSGVAAVPPAVAADGASPRR